MIVGACETHGRSSQRRSNCIPENGPDGLYRSIRSAFAHSQCQASSVGEHRTPILDSYGLVITPDTTFSESPRLDLLVVPGGFGQEALVNDEAAVLKETS